MSAPLAERRVVVRTFDGPLGLRVLEGGDGPPLLCLHGWPQHAGIWQRVAPRLTRHRRMICPDLRGFGWSDAPGRGYGPPGFAADAIALLDELAVERADVLGHDWGGFTAWLLALRHPDRVRRVVVCNAPVPWAPPSAELVRELWRTWYVFLVAAPVLGEALLRTQPAFVRWMLRRDAVHPSITAEEADGYAQRLRRPERAAASSALYRRYVASLPAMVRRSFHGPRLRAPALLLFGTQDAYIPPAMVRGWEGHADDFRVELVPDSGHFLVDERPELVVDRVVSHLG